jgi:gliding motility-associated-like protein
MVMNVSVVNVGCANGADGAIDITVQGGVFPYTYLWSNSATTEDIQHVSGGTFDVTVTDANACTITATFNITEPGAISSSIVGTDVSCNGAHDGAADLTVTGGTGPYTFLWSTFHGSEDVSGLNGGLYYVIIEDANSCEKRDSILINEASAIVLSTVVTNISCANANDGAIDLTVNGGTPTYSYAWSNLATSQDLSALPGGLYVVTVTDIRNCTATTSATIVNPSAIHTNFVVKNPLCHGDSSGRIDMIPSGGTPAYVFSWSNGANVEDLNNVPAGTYIVTITDSRSCNHVDSAVVTEPGQLFTSGVVKNVTCAGLNDGFVDITAYAGSLPYSYLWSTGQSTEDIFNIPGGDYYVTVTDANGCQAVSLYIIQEPLPLGISLAKTDVECYGAATGTIAAIPTGGSVPYYYLWNNFVTDSSINGAIAGHYVVQLTDSNGCFIYDSIDITQSTEIVIAGSVIDANCFGSASGNINVIVSGGIPTYTYNWTNASTDSSLTGVGAGTYGLTVTDSKACQKTETFTVAQPQPMQLHFVPQLPGCFGSSNGALTVDVHQGTEPYTYAWNTTPPQNSESIAGLTAGSYNVTVTDSTGCSASATKTLTQPAEVVLTLNNYNSKCFNDATGMVIVGVSGGVSPFIYTINGHSQPSDTLTGLAPGDYFLVVEDINGCKGTASFQTASPGPISVDVAVTQQVILTGMETQLVASATSNVPILHYFWSPDSVVDYSACPDPQNCTNPLVAPRTTTTFTVTVMNADSCFASDTVTVTVLNQTSAFIPTAFTPNDDQLNDRFEFDILGATNIEVSVFNRWGQRLYYNPSQANGITNLDGWDGKVNGKLAPFDTYVYQMKVTYFDIVTKDIAGTVTLMK